MLRPVPSYNFPYTIEFDMSSIIVFNAQNQPVNLNSQTEGQIISLDDSDGESFELEANTITFEKGFFWFFSIMCTVYLDHLSTLVAIAMFFSNGTEQLSFGIVAVAIYLVNLIARVIYHSMKFKDEVPKAAKKNGFPRWLYPFFLFDIVIPLHENYMNDAKDRELRYKIKEHVVNVGLISLCTDCIPFTLFMFYAYIETTSALALVAAGTSLFSLARNLVDFDFNPLLTIEEDKLQKKTIYIPQDRMELVAEFWDTLVESTAKFCLLMSFFYAYDKRGVWTYVGLIGTFFTGVFLGKNQYKKLNDVYLKYFIGLILVLTHCKVSRYYHPLTKYAPEIRRSSIYCRGLCWIEYRNIGAWRLFQSVFLIALILATWFNSSNIEDNQLLRIIFAVGLGTFGYTFLYNYLWDFYMVYKESFLLRKYLLQNKKEEEIQRIRKILKDHPYLPGSIGNICKIINSYPKLVQTSGFKFCEDLVGRLFKEYQISYNETEDNIEEIIEDIYQLAMIDQGKTQGNVYSMPRPYDSQYSKAFAKKMRNNTNIKSLEIDLNNKEFGEDFFNDVRTHGPNYESLSLTRAKKLKGKHLRIMMPILKKLKEIKLDLTGNQKVNKILKIFGLDGTYEKLRNLSLNLSETELIDGLDTLLWMIYKHSQSLENLTLKIADAKINDERIKRIGSLIFSLKTLKSLVLDFSHNQDITDASIADMLRIFQKLGDKTIITLKVLNCSNVTCYDYRHLISSQSQIIFCSDLACRYTINENTIVEAYKNLTSSDSPHSLELNFSNSNNTNTKDIFETLRHIRTLKDLEILKLNFSGCKWVPENLYKCLDSKDNLQILDINISSWATLGDIDIDNLSKKLGELQSLTHLSYSLTKVEKVTNNEVQLIAQSLQKLPGLKSLSLDLGSCNRVDDEGIKLLANSLMKSYSDLQLNFRNCSKISNDGVIALSKSLKDMEHLESLSLSFQGLSRLSDECVEFLSKNLRDSITRLDLDFSFCVDIMAPAIDALAAGIQTLPFLASIQLNFSACRGVKDPSLLKIYEAVTNLNCLETGDIYLRGCRNLSNEAKAHYKEKFQNLPKGKVKFHASDKF